jgi:hypothetical protein
MPGHFTTLWELRSTSTPSGQLARQAAEYYYSAWAESVKAAVHAGAVMRTGPREEEEQ